MAIPVWASGRVHGWSYAAFVVPGALGGVIELVRWRTKSYHRGRVVDGGLTVLQLWPVLGLLAFLFLGDDIGAGSALVYGACALALLACAFWGATAVLARHADTTTGEQ